MGYGFAYDRAGYRCTGGPKAGAIVLRAAARRIDPALVDLGIYNCRPPRGVEGPQPGEPPVRVSLHGEGRAWDAGTAAGREHGDQLAAALVAGAEELGVQEVIWYARRWTSSARRWVPYDGADLHTTHVHVGLCNEAALTLTLEAALAALTPEPAPPAIEEVPDVFTAISAKGYTWLFEQARYTLVPPADVDNVAHLQALGKVSAPFWSRLTHGRERVDAADAG